jgi:hypothetical protein
MIQGSDAWHQTRLGKVTASKVADVMAKTKTGPSASRTNYMAQLLCERLTGTPADFFMNDAMRWGTEIGLLVVCVLCVCVCVCVCVV